MERQDNQMEETDKEIEAYELFRNLMEEKRDCQSAYKILEENPSLIGFLSLYDIGDYYSYFKMKLGDDKAKKFADRIRTNIEERLELEDFLIPLIELYKHSIFEE